MAGLFTIKVMAELSAAHSIRDYPGDCARVHGHNWKVQAEVKSRKLNDIGIGIDFKDIKRNMQELIDILDHRYINDIPPFDIINPTAENLAKWFYEQLAPNFKDTPEKLAAITIWETDRCSVRYEDD